ncbi:E3 ubiquitin-protein ligase TRIM39-like [Lissotriton helveticus]
MRNKLRTQKKKFEKWQKLMEKNEEKLLDRLEEISNQITSLNALTTEIEQKCKAPAWELLKDARSTLSRCNDVTIQSPEAAKSYKVMVSLDPDTAHPQLLLSEGRRRVRGTGTAQPLPNSPKRFTFYPCVLGSEGFTSGRHYWEVQVLQEGVVWHVGVAAESVNEKGDFTWSPEEGVWAVEGCDGIYKALTSPQTPLSPRDIPLKLGVYLDYEGGRLSLYNADSLELLYTFPWAPFTEKLFPYFCLGGAELKLV